VLENDTGLPTEDLRVVLIKFLRLGLSFYGRPQDKLPNIGMGLAVGIISGTIYTTYLAATRPKTYFEGLVPSIEEERIMGSTLAMTVGRSAVQLQFEWDF
jgi:hypothetical protein